MKKLVTAVILVLFVLVITLSAHAAGQPTITLQPQSPNYPEYSCAVYTVKAEGSNLSATWYLQYNGKTYNTSKSIEGMQPWEAYAGETYGATRDKNTFYFSFNGIEKELDGAELYCVIEDGHYDVKSAVAYVSVVGGDEGMPPEISVPASVTAKKGESVDVRCIAKAPSGEQLTYHWYETSTGKLADIKALPDESEYSDYITCDTGKAGTRYYVCMVRASGGGAAYSSVIPVTVTDKKDTSSASEKDESKVESTKQSSDESAISAESTVSAESTESTQPTESVSSNDDNSGNLVKTLLIVIICLLIAAITVGIIVIINMKKK
ncbi:MAG: hypothetical protein IJO58_06040 [Clostridia bacterium]|nr:hypothetical protein [Clostridia bacterium]